MPKLNLTPEEKDRLIEAMNNGTEPSPDLLPKLFPGTAEKFDIQALDRANIPTLEYAGKRSKAAILAEAGAGIGAAPLQIVRCFGEVKESDWRNLIVQGDNLQFLKTCYKNEDPLIKDKVKGHVKLIYIDPPFATEGEFSGKDGERSYSDKVATSEFVESLRERLLYLREMLADDGCIYLHLDQKMSHYIKVVMDEIFGKENFINQITWKRTFAHGDSGQGAKHLGRISDLILFYVKSNNFEINTIYVPYASDYINKTFKYSDPDGRKWQSVSLTGPGGAAKGNPLYEFLGIKRYWQYSKVNMEKLLSEGKIYQSKPGTVPRKKMYLDESSGVPLQDIWLDIAPVQGGSLENCNYPTQKPVALLERVLLTSTKPDDLIIDLFAGSGTSAAVAEILGRRWIACDFGKHSIYTIQKRIINISDSKKLGIKEFDKETRCEKCGSVIAESGNYSKCPECQSFFEKEVKPIKEKYGAVPKPFCVVSSGAYDFSHIMELRKHKETYIDFVTGLFQLTRDEDKAAKYKLTNIYSVKDNHPVEVYPVWDDQFLKEVKIDETYLQEIITQSGGSLRGEYYIITPESCTNIGDTTLKNHEGKDVQFHMLTFPYKVLEDISRNLILTEQPSSLDNVNNLITSTAFYFNEGVEFAAKRTSSGIKITHFDTKILDKVGKRFEGLSGLAMLLIDLDYETGKPFDMDETIFSNEIGEDGTIKIEGLTKSVGLIAIDKHGNESKPYNLE